MATTQTPEITALSVRERVASAATLMEKVSNEVSSLSDAELLAAVALVEDLGRHVDAARVRVAGEVDERSLVDPESSLARRNDCTSAANLLALTTRVAPAEIRARITLDRRTREVVSLLGDELPADYPAVAGAFRAGAIGMDVALDLTRSFEKASREAVIDPADAWAAECAIVYSVAAGFTGKGPYKDSNEAMPQTFDDYRAVKDAWFERLMSDGIEPAADDAAKYRFVSIGREYNGLVRLSGQLTPEAAGTIQRLFDAYVGSPVRFGTNPEQADADEPWSDDQAPADTRTIGQRRHDMFMSMTQAVAASKDAPTIGGAAPTLVVTVDAAQLEDPAGVADIDGVDLAVPVRVAHRVACTGATQKVMLDGAGRIIQLGSPQRLFTSHQRRAIAARDGGCVIPGCAIPAAWCEVHHVEDHAKGGATHTDNGVLLCWAHHHDIDRSGWQIEMRGGVPFVKAPHWIDHRDIYRPVVNRRSLRARIRQQPTLAGV